MDSMEKQDVQVANAMFEAACRYGLVHSTGASKHNGTIAVEITMAEIGGDKFDIDDMRVLKSVAIERGYRVRGIDTIDNLIQFYLEVK